MSISPFVMSRFARLAVLPLLLTPPPAYAAETRRADATKPAPPPTKATTDIIPLPLHPILPVGQRLCATKTASGLGYTMLRPASGAMPAEADFVLVNYIGYLAATGVVFDQGVRAAFPVNGVIDGFSEGLRMMPKASIARFCIPAAMGYGSQNSEAIPANADLVFQVELIDYKTAAEVEALQNASAPTAPAGSAEPPQ